MSMELVITNLRLLGYNESMNIRMFDVPNMKGFEKLLYFLIIQCQPDVEIPWPILSKKEEAPFRRGVAEFFKLVKVNFDDHGAIVGLLLKPGGPKCVKFLRDFSTFVLIEKMRNTEKLLPEDEISFSLHGKDQNIDVFLIDKYEALAQYHRDRFLARVSCHCEEEQQWHEYYSELLAQYKNVSHEIVTLTKKYPEVAESCEILIEELTVKRTQQVSQFLNSWKKVQSSMSCIKMHTECVKHVLSKQASSSSPSSESCSFHQLLSPESLQLQIPNYLTVYKSERIFENNSLDLYNHDSLDLEKFLHLSQLAIECMEEKLLSLPPITKLSEVDEKALSNLGDQLDNLQLTLSQQTDIVTSQINKLKPCL